MFVSFFLKYRGMILASIFFFYVGCGITISFLRIECSDIPTPQELDLYQVPFNGVEYVVLILSSPGNIEKRDVIRDTWMRFASNIFVENGEKLYKWDHSWTERNVPQDFIKFYFAIGTQNLSEINLKQLYKEHNRSKDLLLLHSFKDSYKKLSLKMLHSLKWLNSNYPNLRYLLKCDDDSFVRIDLIIKDLEAYAPQMNGIGLSKFITYKKDLESYKGLYWGYFDGRARVYLNGKWQEKEWFLCNNYLPYALGGGYVISQSIVNYIAKNADILGHYNSEDVSMGVWTAALDGINRVHDIRFDTEWESRGCSEHMLVRHKQKPSDMFELYKTLVHTRGEKLCKNESMVRKTYKYDWNVLPSNCCKLRN